MSTQYTIWGPKIRVMSTQKQAIWCTVLVGSAILHHMWAQDQGHEHPEAGQMVHRTRMDVWMIVLLSSYMVHYDMVPPTRVCHMSSCNDPELGSRIVRNP